MYVFQTVVPLGSTHALPDFSLLERQNTSRKAFEKALINSTQRKTCPEEIQLFNLGKGDLQNAEKLAIEVFASRSLGEKVTLYTRGNKTGFSTTDIPERIFKFDDSSRTEKSCEDYTLLVKKAQKICQKNNLYFLYPVPSKTIFLNNRYCIMQELVLLLGDGDYDYIAGLYQWAMHHPELAPHMKILTEQIGIFTSLLNYTDVKYDNIALIIKNGFLYVALFDLDDNADYLGLSVDGLCPKGAGDNCLFGMVPSAWSKDLESTTAKYLSPEHARLLHSNLSNSQKVAEERTNERLSKQKFFKEKNVYSCQQLWAFNGPLIDSALEKSTTTSVNRALIRQFMVITFNHVNKALQTVSNLDLSTGRTLELGHENSFQQQLEQENPLFSRAKTYTLVKKLALQTLQKAGYIHSFTISKNSKRFTLVS